MVEDEPLKYAIVTDRGVIYVSVHESDFESQIKRGFVSIYLRFKTFSTGKVYDSLFARDFNGYSGKWNITISGDRGRISEIRRLALDELCKRLDHVKFDEQPKTKGTL